jgi:hypothetical protein
MKKTQHPQKSGLEGSAVFFILKNPVGCNRVLCDLVGDASNI